MGVAVVEGVAVVAKYRDVITIYREESWGPAANEEQLKYLTWEEKEKSASTRRREPATMRTTRFANAWLK